MRITRSTFACPEPEPEEWILGREAGRRGGGEVSDVIELELPNGPVSSGDRTRELGLLEIVMASRRASVKVSSSIDTGSGSS